MTTAEDQKPVAQRLYEHLFQNDGTINDSTTGQLYDEAHGTEDEDTELETVEEWAIDTASRYGSKHNLPLNNQ